MKTESADEFASRKKTITDDANSALVKTAATMKHFYDRKHTGRETPVYEPGRLVWLEAVNIQLTRPSKKLDDRRLGPFTVLASGIGPWPYPHLAALIRLDKWSKGDKSGPAQAIQGHSIS